ncbi:hypothetical protein QL093DRAFT_1034589 [Fusarium oxysporum]|nr:hypothetical protein QL093DRAFT_1034589 [Fusarium oxysporum]
MSPPEQSTTSSSQPVLDETLSNKPNVELMSAQDPAAGTPETTDHHSHGSDSRDNTGKEDNLIDFGDQAADVAAHEHKADAAEQGPSEMVKEKQAADDYQAPSGYLNTHASTAAKIKPIALPSSNDATTQYLTAEPSTYVDPTPATPITSQPPFADPFKCCAFSCLWRFYSS